MSAAQDKKQRQMKLARLEIVAQLFKRGYSRRKIREEVKNRLDLKSYSLGTVQSDVQTLLAEWREDRIENTDDLVQLELERIDDAVRELWEQWEKSKTDYNKTQRKQKGSPSRDGSDLNQDVSDRANGNRGYLPWRCFLYRRDTKAA